MSDSAEAPRSTSRGLFCDEPLAEKFCPQCEARHPHEFKMCPADGTPLIEADELVGTTLSGSYVVTRILGEGGMGRVYEARHTRIGAKRFAIKTLHPELAAVPQLMKRFHREANAAAAIDSPHIVGVFDVDETPDGRPFLVSELLEGVELAEHIASVGKLSTPLAVHIVRELCTAVTAAHTVGAVHRDLKPENVFLTGDPASPTAKVLDFGIAKFDDQSSLTKTGMVMGTPSFMAPEQARGERVDHLCDIYALGAILYCALTGRAPHEGDDPAAVVVSVMTREPPRPRSLEPSIPEALELVLERAMAQAKEHRFQSAGELAQALAPFAVSRTDLASASPGLSATLRSAPTMSRRGPSAESAESAGPVARDALFFGVAGAGSLALALMMALVGLVRLKSDVPGEPVDAVIVALLGVVSVLLVGLPSFVVGRRIHDTAWQDVTRRTQIVEMVRSPVLAGGAVFGLGAFMLRFSELVLVRGPGAGWAGWDPILLSLSALTAAATFLLRRSEARTGNAVGLHPAVIAVVGATLFGVLFILIPVFRG